MPITVFICDDHDVVREGLKYLIEMDQGLKVIGEAGNGSDAIKNIMKLNPDIAIIDISLPGMNGLEVSEQILRINNSTKIIILTMHESFNFINRAIDINVSGYLLKDCVGGEIIKAIYEVKNGHRYMSKKVADYIWSEHNTRKKLNYLGHPLSVLSDREIEILKLVADGKTSHEIADIIFISPKTVETYRSRLMQKLDKKNVSELVKFAIKHGLSSIE